VREKKSPLFLSTIAAIADIQPEPRQSYASRITHLATVGQMPKEKHIMSCHMEHPCHTSHLGEDAKVLGVDPLPYGA
jgi:hypothetical protein